MSAPDVLRMGSAVSYPGIDPRVWQSLAIVTAVSVSTKGCKVDIVLLPSGVAETARVGHAFAGAGVTMYAPIAVDDEVIVAYPNGDRNAGLVVTNRLHSTGDPMPQKVADNPVDFWLVLAEGANINIVTDTGKVRLGDHEGTSPVGRVGDSIEVGYNGLPPLSPISDIAKLQSILDLRYMKNPPIAPATDAPPMTPFTGVIASGSAKVEAK